MILLFSEGVMKNRISLNRFVEVACTNPAKVYGLYPKKGILEPGADADLIILDPEREHMPICMERLTTRYTRAYRLRDISIL